MRVLSLFAVLFLATLVAGPCALAEENADKEKSDEIDPAKVEIPSFSIEDLVPEKDALLEGWTVLQDDPPAGHPSEEALMALAEAHGLDEDSAYVEQRVVKTPGGASAGAAMMDIDADPAKFIAALKAKATEAGWIVRELATPKRLLIVGGDVPVRDEIAAELSAHVVYEFASMARHRLNIRTSWDKEQVKAAKAAAYGFIKAGRALNEKAGVLAAIESFFTLRKYMGKRHEYEANKKRAKDAKSDDKEDEFRAKSRKAKAKSEEHWKDFVADARKALDTGVPLPPRGTLLASLAGQGGGQILVRKDGQLDLAIEWLEKAVAAEAMDMSRKYGDRYNLACAYARKGDKEKAFEWLTKSLETGNILPFRQYGAAFVHMEKKDEDMKPLRGDDRWDALIKKWRNDKVEKYVAEKKKQEERKKKEAEARKKAGGH